MWLFDLERSTGSRLTFDPLGDGTPIWSPDGSRIVFGSNRLGLGQVNLYEKAAGGAGDEQLLLQSDAAKFATSWSRDGQFILFENWAPKAKAAIWYLPVAGDRQPKPLLQNAAFDHGQGQFSPDGRFVSYASNESGRAEIYVQTFPTSGSKWQISTNGGMQPLWRGDGKELFFITEDNKLMSAEIKADGPFQSSVPRQLFATSIKHTFGYSYATTPDGQRFLVNVPVEAGNRTPMTIVLNWTASLKPK